MTTVTIDTVTWFENGAEIREWCEPYEESGNLFWNHSAANWYGKHYAMFRHEEDATAFTLRFALKREWK